MNPKNPGESAVSSPAPSTASGNCLLQISDLQIRFATFANLAENAAAGGDAPPAVDRLSLRIDRGEIVGLAGESGSGKSVTALAIPQLLPPQAQILPGSSILLDGVELTTATPAQLRHIRAQRIGMVFQEPMTALHPAQRIGTQLTEALRFRQTHRSSRKQTTDRAVELLDNVGVRRPRQRLQSYPHELSGGQRQRVVIAMALAGEPDLLIADEPTTALDVTVQMQILQLLEDLQHRFGMAVLLISHDLGVVSGMASRMYIMRSGRVVETGGSQRIISRPKDPYTLELLRAVPHTEVSAAGRKNIGDKPLLEAENVGVKFRLGDTLFASNRQILQAVQEMSFRIAEGETLGIVGESGCGKSTLAKALVGLVQSSGSLRWRGEIVGNKPSTSWRRSVQFVFQDPFGALSPRLTVAEIIGEGLNIHEPHLSRAQWRQRILAILQDMDLGEEMLRRFPHELSGGQRQRVALARSLVLNPQLLILDEPTSALDMSVQAQIVELLRRLQEQRGIAYIFISHDLKLVRSLADRIIVMRDGRTVETGDGERIFSRPEQPYTEQLVAAAQRYALPAVAAS